jgi:hypothetical protein
VASPLGHFGLSVAGHDKFVRHATRAIATRGLSVQVQQEITPFADMFPFNRVGVSSLYFFRSNFSGGRWQHHSQHDTLENISTEPVARLLTAVAPLVVHLGGQKAWPFRTGLPAPQQRLARQLGRDLLGD